MIQEIPEEFPGFSGQEFPAQPLHGDERGHGMAAEAELPEFPEFLEFHVENVQEGALEGRVKGEGDALLRNAPAQPWEFREF